MIKLYKARSLVYRRQILQENIRWKALDEIYKIYMLLQRSDLKISAKFVQFCCYFKQKMHFQTFIFSIKFIIFILNVHDIVSEFRDNSQLSENI